MASPNPALIAMRAVEARTSLSRRTIARKIAAGEFPAPIDVTPTRIAFVEAEVDAWIEEVIARHRRRPAAANGTSSPAR